MTVLNDVVELLKFDPAFNKNVLGLQSAINTETTSPEKRTLSSGLGLPDPKRDTLSPFEEQVQPTCLDTEMDQYLADPTLHKPLSLGEWLEYEPVSKYPKKNALFDGIIYKVHACKDEIRNCDWLKEEEIPVYTFDMDGTLIEENEDVSIKTDHGDSYFKPWKILERGELKAKTKIQSLRGGVLFILSNQGTVAIKKRTMPSVKKQMDELVSALDVSIPIIVAFVTDWNIFRKPSPGGLAVLEAGLLSSAVHQWTSNIPSVPSVIAKKRVKLIDSFFVGDAAGRPKPAKQVKPKTSKFKTPPTMAEIIVPGYRLGQRKDHSNCDVLFAINAGIDFYTPESYFLGLSDIVGKHKDYKTTLYGVKYEDLEGFSGMHCRNATPVEQFLKTKGIDPNETQVLMLVGAMGSGKTRFSRYMKTTYEHCRATNFDLEGKVKTSTLLKTWCDDPKGILILDRTHVTDEQRKKALEDLILSKDVKISCLVFSGEDNVLRQRAIRGTSFRAMFKSTLENRFNVKIPHMVIYAALKNLRENRENNIALKKRDEFVDSSIYHKVYNCDDVLLYPNDTLEDRVFVNMLL